MGTRQIHLLFFTATSAAVILAMDVLTPLGFTAFNLYVGVVLLASWLQWPQAVLWTAAGCTALIPLGALLSPTGSTDSQVILVNRSIAAGAIWLVALLIIRRKRAEAGERLAREARDYAESIVETVREPLVILDADLRVRQANRSFYDTFRTTPEATQRRLFLELGNGQWDIPRLRELLETVIPHHAEFSDFEAEYEITSVGRRTMVLNGRTLYRPGNNTGQILLAIEDVTERRLAAEERERAFASSLDLQCVAGFDGYFKRLNPAWERTLGFSLAELMAEPFINFIHPDDRERTLAASRQTYEGVQILAFENRYRCKDGSYRWLQWTANPSVERRVTYATARDITEHKQAKEDTARLAAIVESSHDAIISKTLDSIVTSWNRGAEQLFGYAADEMIGQSVTILFPPDRLEEEARILACIKRGEQLEHFETLRRAKDGRLIDVSLTISPIRDERGTITAVSKIARDITVRKRTEEEIRRKSELLEAANKELEAFSYSVSHDLRAPLRHIDGFAELLNKHATALDEKSRRYLRTISESAKQMGALIDDLLQFSRIGRAELRHDDVNLDQLVKGTLAGLAQDVNGRNITWSIAGLPTVQGDPSLLRQVFINLLSNAVKYTRERDQARIEVGTLGRTADGQGAPVAGGTASGQGSVVGGGSNNDEVVIFVRDNGAGFDMQYADKLFGVFQRLHNANEFEGTGIGLANVKRIITRHGGRTWAEGRVGEGATFYVAFPTRKEARNDD